jgi:energy-coupling factor transport system ATP-binding protein
MPPIIALHNVTFTYAIASRPALRQVSLAVPPGQICGVVGRAGAGKTTLCVLCAGFIPNFYQGRFSGDASVDGQDVIQKPVAELVRHVGLVGSNPFSQISGARFTVFGEVGFGLENLGVPRAEMIERIEWALRVMQIEDLRDRSPYALSGGQQQRLVLATALALRPPVLVLDEPTAQLDPPSTAQLAALLRDLARQGTTILFAEHRLEWTAELADRIVVLDDGQLIADGAPGAVLTDPQLLERGIGWPRPALLAARTHAAGLWPDDRPLPATFDGLVAGLREPRGGNEAPSTKHQAPRTRTEEQGTNGGVARMRGVTPGTPDAKRVLARERNAGVEHPRPIVQLEAVRFTYPSGVEALRGISLTIGAGEPVALLGRNGAGKSTLVRHLNGLLRPSSGRVLVAGADTRTMTVARCARHVGLVFQDIRNQLFARTVRDELRFGPRNLGYDPARVEWLVDRSLEALGLAEVAAEHPYDLPVAQRRLVAIAAVLAMDSDVLVLDEPTAGLDHAAIARLTGLVRQLVAQGKSVIVVSHDLDFCFDVLERVILLRDGRIVLDGRWETVDSQALAEEVGLPLPLHVARALDLPRDSELATLLAAPLDTQAVWSTPAPQP